MKAAPFAYFAADSAEEVVALLAEHGDEAKVLAGGQSLMPLMALRLATPNVLVDVNCITGLDYIERGAGHVRLGALVRQRAVEQDTQLLVDCPMIGDAVPMIGHVAVRNRGTVAGSLTHADPAAEWPALAVALDARLTAVGPSGGRKIVAESFFDSYLSNTLRDDEFVTHVEFDLPSGVVGSSYVELARRHGDFGLCGVAAVLCLTPDGVIDDARVVVSGCGSTALRIGDCERVIIGERPSPRLFEDAAEVVFKSVDPHGDIHGSADYRRHVTRVVARRALGRASARAANAAEVLA